MNQFLINKLKYSFTPQIQIHFHTSNNLDLTQMKKDSLKKNK
jgi:hypothetical protein